MQLPSFEREQRRFLLCLTLIALIVVAAILLATKDLGDFWTVIAQVTSAIAGAWLGAILGTFRERDAAQSHARPALRHLFDHANRLRSVVLWIDERRLRMEQVLPEQRTLTEVQSIDWLATVGDKLRDELDATASSANDWRDLAPAAFEDEIQKYTGRDAQLPGGMTDRRTSDG